MLQQIVYKWERVHSVRNNLCKQFTSLWRDLFDMYHVVTNGIEPTDQRAQYIFDHWDTFADAWIERFLLIHDAHNFRIYVHLLLAHGKDLYQIYGPLRWVSNQGCEAANGRDVAYYHQHTAKNGGKLSGISEIGKKRKRELQSFATLQNTIIHPYIIAQTPPPSQTKKPQKPHIVINSNIQMIREQIKNAAIPHEPQASRHTTWEVDPEYDSSEEEIAIDQ